MLLPLAPLLLFELPQLLPLLPFDVLRPEQPQRHHEESDPALYLYNPVPPVEFFAPGQNIEVAWLGGTVIRSTGNSFATPVIAGLCARILSRYPRMTTFQLKNALYLSAANVRVEARSAA